MKIVFEINEKEYEIKELTIADYYDLKMKLLALDEKDTFELVCKLTNCPEDILRLLPYENWLSIVVAVQEEINKALGLIQIPFQTILRIDDIEYGLIAFEQMTLGEFLDLDIIISSDQAEWKLHEIMSIIFRPIIDDTEEQGYVTEPYDNIRSSKRANKFKDIALSQARMAMGFFLVSVRKSLDNILESSLREMKQAMNPENWKRLKKIVTQFQESGSISSTSLLEKTRLNLMKYQNYTSEQPLTGSPGRSTSQTKNALNTKRLFPNININNGNSNSTPR